MARIDDHPAKMIGDGAGTQLIFVPPGKHRVDVFLVDTPARTFGALCSAFGFVLICILALVPGRVFTWPHWISRKRNLLRDKSGQQDTSPVEPGAESAGLNSSRLIRNQSYSWIRNPGSVTLILISGINAAWPSLLRETSRQREGENHSARPGPAACEIVN